MRQLHITELSFCENADFNVCQVQGGITTAKYSATYSADKSSAKSAGYYVDRKTGHISAYTAGSVAGAIGAAIAVGGVTYVSTSTGTGVA